MSTFGKYKLICGFGVVYLGHGTPLERLVAGKVWCGGTDVPQEAVQGFLQEARRRSRLQNVGIVAVPDVDARVGLV